VGKAIHDVPKQIHRTIEDIAAALDDLGVTVAVPAA
jgi:hypothetical protein